MRVEGQLVLRLARDAPLGAGARLVLAHREAGARLLVARRGRREVLRAQPQERLQLVLRRAAAVGVEQDLAQVLADGDRRVRGRVDAAADARVDLAERDLVRDQVDRLQAGAARLLDVVRGRLRREAAAEHGLAGQVEVAAVLQHGAGHDLAEPLALEVVAGDEPVERGGQHVLVGGMRVLRVRARERDAVAADHGDSPGTGGHRSPWGLVWVVEEVLVAQRGAGLEAGLDGRDEQLGGVAGRHRAGPQPPARERLGGAQQRVRERLDLGRGALAVALGDQRELRRGDQRQQAVAVDADRAGQLAAGRQRLVEQHAPGVAVAVDEGEEGPQALAQRVGRAGRSRHGGADGGQHRLARVLHAGEVEPLLVAEVGVQQRLRDARRRGHLVHRDGAVAVLGEQPVRDLEHLQLALLARQPAAGRRCGRLDHAVHITQV